MPRPKEKNMNRAKQIPVITITVVSKVEGQSIKYHMYNDQRDEKKTHTFIAKSNIDQDVISGMKVGNSYKVHQTVCGPHTRWVRAELIGVKQVLPQPVKRVVRSMDGRVEREQYLKSLGIEY
jgi:hypothetical protein